MFLDGVRVCLALVTPSPLLSLTLILQVSLSSTLCHFLL